MSKEVSEVSKLLRDEKRKERKKAEKMKTHLIKKSSPLKAVSNNGGLHRLKDNEVKSSESTIEDFLQTVSTNQFAKRKRSRSKKTLQFETCDIATL